MASSDIVSELAGMIAGLPTNFRAVERSVIIQIADMIANVARSNASWSSTIPRSTTVSEATELPTGMAISINVNLKPGYAPSARAFEFGSGIHATRGTAGKYDITPINAPELVFMGTHDFAGKMIHTQIVHHPGVAPRPFLSTAVEYNRTAALDLLREAVGSSIRMTIQEAWRKQ